MQQDSKFHAALGTVTSWKISKGKLILIDAKKREVLRLKRA
jgi:heat shock protein HslJ